VNHESKLSLGRLRRKWQDNIKVEFKEIAWGSGLLWNWLRIRSNGRAFLTRWWTFRFFKSWELRKQLVDYRYFKEDPSPVSQYERSSCMRVWQCTLLCVLESVSLLPVCPWGVLMTAMTWLRSPPPLHLLHVESVSVTGGATADLIFLSRPRGIRAVKVRLSVTHATSLLGLGCLRTKCWDSKWQEAAENWMRRSL
jgi:hypothetical protein